MGLNFVTKQVTALAGRKDLQLNFGLSVHAVGASADDVAAAMWADVRELHVTAAHPGVTGTYDVQADMKNVAGDMFHVGQESLAVHLSNLTEGTHTVRVSGTYAAVPFTSTMIVVVKPNYKGADVSKTQTETAEVPYIEYIGAGVSPLIIASEYLPLYLEATTSGEHKLSILNVPSSMEYSTDLQKWHKCTGSDSIGSAPRVYLKHTGALNTIGDFITRTVLMLTGGAFRVGGNILSLYLGDNWLGETDKLPDGCFEALFAAMDVIDASKLVLSNAMGNSCYYGLFQGCKQLVAAPVIRGNEDGFTDCLSSAFSGCSALSMLTIDGCTLEETQVVTTLNGTAAKGMVQLLNGATFPDSALPSGWIKG